ncbi:hypothetical protein PHMEG_0001440 [Phytophthora megakarya]|uniref:Uncharacterized protein n=1 Tax=Phytophthora megakarya TaxID=4795 RepID=A0A225X189_9STRA|nr:hypothetical protein PHMEG_0001440 [Phytophthora megakarya]
MLFDRNSNLVGVGDKCFRISASSRDPEITTTHSLSCKWEVTYARHGAVDLAITPGNAIFWPASFTHEALALEYTRRSLSLNQLVASESTANPIPLEAQSLNSIWMALTPRKGICMKLLATQIGHLKKLQEVHILQTKPDKSKASKANRKLRKPHFPGQQLNKIAVDTTQ